MGLRKTVTGDQQNFPSLKDALVVRMAPPASQRDKPKNAIAPPNLPTDAASITLPTIIERARLEAQRPRESNTHPPASPARWRANLIASFVAIFLAGFLSAFALYWTGLIPGTTKTPLIAQQKNPVWPDLLAPGPISPRGQNSSGVTPDQAFQMADAKLHGLEAPPDHEEARYWLRIGISGALSGDRLRWALTQLGTLYAKPTASQSEYEVARSVWELAAAQKDPVALCFLARLDADLPSTQPNKEIALKFLEQAKATGGCGGTEQTIEPLSR